MPDYIEHGETLVLRSPDPGVAKAKGHRRFLLGVDLGQGPDPSAWTIIEDLTEPFWRTTAVQDLHPRRRTVVAAGRIPGAAYTEVARIVRNITQDPAVRGRVHVVADAGGVGRAWADVAEQMGVKLHRVQIVGGDNETETREPGRRFYNVGKGRLMAALNSALHTKELTIGAFPLREELAAELDSFQVTFGDSGRARIEGGTKNGHADIAMSVSLALWLSDLPSLNAFHGVGKIVNWV